ncbi:MAG: RNA-binding S4 domain-containing protein [Bacteroidales bacterium]
MEEFNLRSDYITLIQLLKTTRIAQSGGEAQILVEDEQVLLNGKVEHRKRAKLRDGDIVEFMDRKILIKK